MFGHHYVSHEQKVVRRTHFVENSQERVALSCSAEQRLPPVATASDEMKMVLTVASLKAISQRQAPRTRDEKTKNNPHPLQNPQRVRHPQIQLPLQNPRTTRSLSCAVIPCVLAVGQEQLLSKAKGWPTRQHLRSECRISPLEETSCGTQAGALQTGKP